MCVGTEQTRQRSKMKGRHGQGEREKEGVRHMATLDRVLEGCSNTELGEDAEIKNDNRKECLDPRSGCLNWIKFAEIARWELKLEKLSKCKETVFYCMPSSFPNKRYQEESVHAHALFTAAPGFHTVSDVRTETGLRPRQSRTLR